MNCERAIGCALLVCSGALCAQQPFDLDPTFRAEFDDWYVSSILPRPDGTVIISGQFSFPGGEPGEFTGVGRLNADGTWDPSFENSDLGRGKMVEYNNGFYISTPHTVRRVFFDGSWDQSFIEMNNGPYFSSLQGGDYHVYPDGRILLSGAHEVNYPDSNWVGYYNLIWFTNQGYLDTTRAPRMGDGTIDYFKELPDGKFICTGAMSQFEGQPTCSIFRVEADGRLDTSFNAHVTWGQAFGFLPLTDGRCYASGLFIQNNSSDTLQLVRFMPDGSLDPTFNNHMRFGITAPYYNLFNLGSVDRIYSLDAGRLIVTGQFRDVDGETRGSICLVDTTGNLLDDYFVDAACGAHNYMGVTLAAIAGIIIGDSASYIWGDYHGYTDGTTSDPLQRFVTRLYGTDFGMGVERDMPGIAMQLYPNPTTGRVTLRLEQLPHDVSVIVRDAFGREVLRKRITDHYTTLTIERSGVYVLDLYDTSGRIASERVVVE